VLCDITVASETARIGDPHVASVWAWRRRSGDMAVLVGISTGGQEFFDARLAVNGTEAERNWPVKLCCPAEKCMPEARKSPRNCRRCDVGHSGGRKLSVNRIHQAKHALIPGCIDVLVA